MKKKILITGSSGFLGNLAIEYYSQNYDLVLVDKINSKHKNFYNVDVVDFERLDQIICKEKPNIIFHFASELFDSYNQEKIHKTNVLGTYNVYKSAIRNNVENLIFISSIAIFEKNYEYLINEIEPPSCKNPYGKTKAEIEKFLLNSNSNLDISIFRCPTIVEKSRAHRLGVLFEFLKEDCNLWLLGDGSNKIHIGSASDLFNAIDKSLTVKGKNIYNIGCEKNESMKETFEFLINKTGSKSKIRYLNKTFGLLCLKILSLLRLINFTDWHAKGLVSNIVLDISRIKNELNFLPNKSGAELLLDTYNSYINNASYEQKGSAIKPKMGFFKINKLLSKII